MNLSQGPKFLVNSSNSWSQSGPVSPDRATAGGKTCSYPTPPPSAEYCTPAAYSREIGGDKYSRLSTAYGASTKRT